MGTSQHTDTISAIQWKPDGSEFLVSSMDCKLIFYVSDVATILPLKHTTKSAAGIVVRQWSFNSLQVGDFVITPDGTHIVAVTTSLKRVPIENKLKPSMSARVAALPSTGIALGTASTAAGNEHGGFGYGSMEHAVMIVRLTDMEITE